MSLLIEQEAPPLMTDAQGTVRVGQTRVTLETVVHCYNQGATAEQIAEDFDTLKLADVHSVIAYYLNHRAEVDAYLKEQDRKAAEIRAKIEAEPGYWEARARLVARKEAYLKQRQGQESAE